MGTAAISVLDETIANEETPLHWVWNILFQIDVDQGYQIFIIKAPIIVILFAYTNKRFLVTIRRFRTPIMKPWNIW